VIGAVEQKTLEIQHVRTELEDKLRSEHSQTHSPVRADHREFRTGSGSRARRRQTTHRLRPEKASQAACRLVKALVKSPENWGSARQQSTGS